MPVRRINLTLLILASFGMLAWSLTRPGSLHYPLAYPQTLLLLIGGLFATLLVQDLRAAPQRQALRTGLPAENNGSPVALARFFATVALTLVYVLVWDSLGYFPSTLLFILALLLILGERRWPVVVGIPVVLTVLIYLVFYRFLLLPLPMGPLQDIL